MSFSDSASAGNASLIGYGGNDEEQPGVISFVGDSTGGTAAVDLSDNAVLIIGDHNPPGVTIGSLSGSSSAILGARTLTVGSNNLSTDFSGVIQGRGSLTKIGRGTLTFTGANLYRTGTTLQGGTMLVNNITGSGTGNGPVRVENGTLGGTGIIAGAVTVGDGTGREASLAPHHFKTLTILSTLLLDSNATFRIRINSNSARAGAVAAKGVTINAAQLSVVDARNTTLPAGTTFTVVNNTASTLINGTFANLLDGATITIGNNTFQANYEGGDGNDLTLTVVP